MTLEQLGTERYYKVLDVKKTVATLARYDEDDNGFIKKTYVLCKSFKAKRTASGNIYLQDLIIECLLKNN